MNSLASIVAYSLHAYSSSYSSAKSRAMPVTNPSGMFYLLKSLEKVCYGDAHYQLIQVYDVSTVLDVALGDVFLLSQYPKPVYEL